MTPKRLSDLTLLFGFANMLLCGIPLLFNSTISPANLYTFALRTILTIAMMTVSRRAIRDMTTDRLTGLQNRMGLDGCLESLKKRRTCFSFLFIDLDNFKGINDTHGHTAGDQVLCDVADIMRQVTQGSDRLFRYGGDEFLIISPAAGVYAPYVVKTRLQEELGKRHISASIGVSTWTENGESFHKLLDGADQAMYREKHGNRPFQSNV